MQFANLPLKELLEDFPYVEDFFQSIGLDGQENRDGNLLSLVNSLEEETLEESGLDREKFIEHFQSFMERMAALKAKSPRNIHSLTIIGGEDKSGCQENVELTLKAGEIISIVGPTGAGKSRLLADIECLAQGDTPSKRKILINGLEPSSEKRFSLEHKLVAQLSQNMNFVMDLTVGEFIEMHAQSRLIENVSATLQNVLSCANQLAGESFSQDTLVTQLSGGQSRALMIADTALLSLSPIVLIDEIENAGVDRKKALNLLVKEEKIVLMSTHDPILALMGQKRIVIKNGGISKIIVTSQEEQNNLDVLQNIDTKMLGLRSLLRSGQTIEFDVREYFVRGESQ